MKRLFALLGTVLAFTAQPAAAAIMLATYTGTVVHQTSYDPVDFGPLHGAAFTMTFRYDTQNFSTLGQGIEQVNGGTNTTGTMSPILAASMTIEGAPEFSVNSVVPRQRGTVTNYDSSFNSTFGMSGYTVAQAEYETRDDSAGYIDFALFQMQGYATTGDHLDTPYASAIWCVPGQCTYQFGLRVNHQQVRSLSVELNPTTVSLVALGVPEPATWAIMMLGFGAIGGAMRRRRWAAPIAP